MSISNNNDARNKGIDIKDNRQDKSAKSRKPWGLETET